MIEQTLLFAPPESDELRFDIGGLPEANPLLNARHYLGPVDSGSVRLVVVGRVAGRVVAAMVWKTPTARRIPTDWLELSRWCLTPEAGPNAGSRMHRYAVRELRRLFPAATTLVSYSDPSVGHTGSLYRACNWLWKPTWHVLRPPPTGGGSWDGETFESPKERWVFYLREDPNRDAVLVLDDESLARRFGADVAAGRYVRPEERKARR